MKTFVVMSGFYEGLRARRLEVFGRLELLQIINDPPPYWFIRLRGSRPHDEKYWDGKDTGLCWRFAHLEPARAKFKELCSHGEYQLEAQEAILAKNLARQRALERIASGELKTFKAKGA